MTTTRKADRLTPTREGARLSTTRESPAAGKEQAMPGRGLPSVHAVHLATTGLVMAMVTSTAACTPTLRIEASDKPITINLNVKIDQEIRYRLDKDLEDAIAANPDLF
jgi:YnbE-like lipoprotein